MKQAEINLKKDVATITITPPAFPIISNYSATPTTDPESIRTLLAQQVCGRVRWVESVRAAITTYKPTIMVEFGAGNVLTGLAKRIDNSLARKNFYGRESL